MQAVGVQEGALHNMIFWSRDFFYEAPNFLNRPVNFDHQYKDHKVLLIPILKS
uniref:Uncharacterized protein n=1 Tax=Caenorhabditis elegans TaxID=6239 RepID=Q9TZE5_CAEEL|eukprot:NP_494725.1 Uncharacterized protein CELE_Y54C5A.1 [Caenorhabditis elegans]